MELDAQTVKKIVKEELPGLMKRDKNIRRFILELSKEQFTETREKTVKLEKETESRFELLLDELRKDREEQTRKWEEQNKKWEEQNKRLEEQNKRWEGQDKKWEENQEEIRKLYRAFTRKHDTTLGALGARWGR
jgi:DNA repair photolyase